MRSAVMAVVALLVGAGAARATTLVNDPAHPFTAAQLGEMQQWVDVAGGRVRTPAGSVTVSKQECLPVTIAACQDGRVLKLPNLARFDLLHELGHADQTYDGPGDPLNYPSTSGWSSSKKLLLAYLLHVPVPSFTADNWFWGGDSRSPRSLTIRPPTSEVSADAYAECAMRPRWRRWWAHPATATPHNFRAGPRRYKTICSLLLAD